RMLLAVLGWEYCTSVEDKAILAIALRP
ncbi:hypothetical protein MGSAQ_001414, partial [marine sediment metagenome]